MRTSTARSQRSWEPHTMFVCLALLAAASFEIQGLVKDLRSVSVRKLSEFQPDARSEGESDQSSNPEELTSGNHDESEEGGSDQSHLRAIDALHQSSAPSIRPLHRGTRHGRLIGLYLRPHLGHFAQDPDCGRAYCLMSFNPSETGRRGTPKDVDSTLPAAATGASSGR